MAKSDGSKRERTDVQVIIEHMDDQIKKVVESAKMLHEISMGKIQHMSERLEKVEYNIASMRLETMRIDNATRMLKS